MAVISISAKPREMTQTILYPSYRNQRARGAGGAGRPDRLAQGSAPLRLYDRDSPEIDLQIKASIVNTMSPQAHHFPALPE